MNEQERGIRIVPMVIGHMDIGKTTMAKQVILANMPTPTVEIIADDLTPTIIKRQFDIPVVNSVQLSGQEKRRERRKANRKK